ncbi:histidinol-phosphate transaminase [Paenibacillus polysaccharolyticus]|uniref:histidinol-phosphate transaminase n=1 Tax=Paenibacillus polysaccharolyticus TaxID=582692 RepID=UPI00203EBE66|nr:histidinol-phosphate transaminase [Paenibacillus polysaccharolyticus]MCM3132896.1 histidinol-phosphate transaminase [Paenibacillus polysaccharolyticus]
MSDNWTQLLRPSLLNLKPFSSAAMARLSLQTNSRPWIFLESNENPNVYGEEAYNRYPEPQPREVVARLGELYSVPVDQILLTRGSAEGLDLIIRLVCEPYKDEILTLWPDFELIEQLACIQGCSLKKVILKKENGFRLSMDEVNNMAEKNIKLVYLSSPNNPTGQQLHKDMIVSICEKYRNKAVVVIDEAYVEYAEQESISSLLQDFEHLLILRTLSKAYGLAGIRCGAVLSSPEIITYLQAMLHPAPIPQPTADIVVKVLSKDKIATIHQAINDMIEQRNELGNRLINFNFVRRVFKSEGNFILLEVEQVEQLMAFCYAEKILIRDKSTQHALEDCVRITIGSESENARLLQVFKQFQLSIPS